MIHQLKCETEYFEDIANEVKKYEVRKNDRFFKAGDHIGLNELTPDKTDYTGRWMLFKITHILADPQYVKEGYVILSLAPCFVEEEVKSTYPSINDRDFLHY